MKKNGISRTSIRWISFLAFACVLLGVSSFVNARKAERSAQALELTRQRALSVLCDSLDEIEVALMKSCYSGSASSLSELSQDMSSAAANAKLCLGALDCGDTQTGEIYTFLSQVGAYTRAISSGEYSVKENAENLRMLRDYSAALSDGISAVSQSYYDGSVSFSDTVSTLNLDSTDSPALFSNSVSDAQQTLTDYPTLIYDGPFSESEQQAVSRMTDGMSEITRVEARKIAAKLFGKTVRDVDNDGDEEGTMPLFCFTCADSRVGITKKGGLVCYIISSYYAGETTIGAKAAVERAAEFLRNLGYTDMKESYYSVYDGICTVNFSWEQQGITVYSDLIKVGVALDTGKAISLDARGYLMNHTVRELPEIKVTPEKAQASLNPTLRVSSTKTALIPKNSGEVLCYEFLCKNTEDNDALIYVNAVTGEEEQVLLLLYSDNGTLTQ